MAKIIGVIFIVCLCAFIIYELYSIVRNVVATVRERKAKKTVSIESDKTNDSTDKS